MLSTINPMPYLPAFIAPTCYTDPAAVLSQRLIYDQQISHLRTAMQRYLAGETIPNHVRACYPFVRVQTDTVALGTGFDRYVVAKKQDIFLTPATAGMRWVQPGSDLQPFG